MFLGLHSSELALREEILRLIAQLSGSRDTKQEFEGGPADGSNSPRRHAGIPGATSVALGKKDTSPSLSVELPCEEKVGQRSRAGAIFLRCMPS